MTNKIRVKRVSLSDCSEDHGAGVLVFAGGSGLVRDRGLRFVFGLLYLLLSSFQPKTNTGSIPQWTGKAVKFFYCEMNLCECSNEPSGSIKCGEFLD